MSWEAAAAAAVATPAIDSSFSSSYWYPVPVQPVNSASLVSLLRFFLFDYSTSRSFRSFPQAQEIQTQCIHLFQQDYYCNTINNTQGELCSSYPLEIIIIQQHKQHHSSPPLSPLNDFSTLSALFRSSRFNRVHARFVVPVLVYKQHNICRSSTLAIHAEAVFNNVTHRTKEFIGNLYESVSASFGFNSNSSSGSSSNTDSSANSGHVSHHHSHTNSLLMVDESYRQADEQLLRVLRVKSIADLMVEHRKKKLGMAITSSEKSESQTAQQQQAAALMSHEALSINNLSVLSSTPYSDCSILALPFPGCEFFSLYSATGHSAVGLVFDWNQGFVNSVLQLDDAEYNKHITLSGDQEDDLYEGDTHWACWKKQRAETQKQQNQNNSNSYNTQQDNITHVSGIHDQVDGESMPSSVALNLAAADTVSKSSNSRAESSLSFSVSDLLSSVSAAAETSEEDNDSGSGSGYKKPLHLSVTSAPSAYSYARQTKSSYPTVIPWNSYKEWSVITLTKNYLLLLLSSLCSDDDRSGLLLHCVSGWDRTPLFISLMRLSLWADGEAHVSLSAVQILYLTLAYDWMLFSHHLANRLSKDEDIMYFCFDFLQFITAKKFCIQHIDKERHKHNTTHTVQTKKERQDRSKSQTGSAAVTHTSINSAPASHNGQPRAVSPNAVSPPLSIQRAPASLERDTVIATASSTDDSVASPESCDSLPASQSHSQTSAGLSHSHAGGSWTMIHMLHKGDEATTSKDDLSSNSESNTPSWGPVTVTVNSPDSLTTSSSNDEQPPTLTLSPTRNQQPQTHSTTERRTDTATSEDSHQDEQEEPEQEDDNDLFLSARRCERLMHVRTLFMTTYHTILPHSFIHPCLLVVSLFSSLLLHFSPCLQ